MRDLKVGDEANRVPPHMRELKVGDEANRVPPQMRELKVGDEANRVPPHMREKTSGEKRKVPPHLEDLLQRATKGWNQKQQQQIKQMFLDFEDCFSKHDYDIGQTHLIKHEIDTGPTPPFRSPLRLTPKTIEEEGQATLKQLEKYKFIQPSTNPWSSPICFVRKPDGQV